MRRLLVAAAAVLALGAPGSASACRALVASGSIQEAVDEAQPCDWVLVPPGVYDENVVIATPNVHVRGLNRNNVVLDGGHRSGVDGIAVQADGVTLENLTVRDFDAAAAVRWTAHRWRGNYLTAFDTGTLGARGLSAETGSDGVWDHVYVRGFAESGVACAACRAVLSHALAERNRIGVSAAGPAARLTLQDSLLRTNTFGVEMQTEVMATVRRNRVEANERIGIDLAATSRGLVANNVLTGNRIFGIVVHDGSENRVTGNVIRGSRYDVALSGTDDCVSGNRLRTSLPEDLHPWRCGAPPPEPDSDASQLVPDLIARLELSARTFRAQAAPPSQPSMRDACAGVPANSLCPPRKKVARVAS
jgi:parallel beta-helix repeat protein